MKKTSIKNTDYTLYIIIITNSKRNSFIKSIGNQIENELVGSKADLYEFLY